MNKLLTFAAAAALLAGCSSDSQHAGGSDLPNGYVSGIVVSSAGSSQANATLKIADVTLTATGDSVIWSQTVQSENDGTFSFSNVENGSYVITAEGSNGEKAILGRFTKGSSNADTVSIKTAEPVDIRGRVISGSSTPESIYLAGTDISAKIESNGFYTLPSVPRGELELTISDNNELSILQLALDQTVDTDTMFIRDCQFDNASGEVYDLHDAPISAKITYPEFYGIGNEPAWYQSVDFNGVTYETEKSDDVRDLWHFPLLIEVPEEALGSFGSLENARDSIQSMLITSNRFFSSTQFEGRILFTIDSIGTTANSDINSATAPSSRFAARVLVNPLSDLAQWNKSTKSVVVNKNNLTQGLALTRGAIDLRSYRVSGENNPVNSDEFAPDSLVMFNPAGEKIDELSLYSINRNKAKANASSSVQDTFPKITVKVTVDGSPVSTEVMVYGVDSRTATIDISPRYDSSTTVDGLYTIPEDAFQSGAVMNQYHNFLFEVKIGNKKYYQWLPKYEVLGAFISTNESEYFIHFDL